MESVRSGICSKRAGIALISALMILILFISSGCERIMEMTPDTPTDQALTQGADKISGSGTEISPTAAAEPEDRFVTIDKSEWVDAYKETITTFDTEGAYELIFLNNDDVPEVVYMSDTAEDIRECFLYSYYEDALGGHVICGLLSTASYSPRYLPGEGYIICQSRDYQGMDTDNIYLLKNGLFHSLFKGVVLRDDSPMIFNITTEEKGSFTPRNYVEYSELMNETFNRYLELEDCGNGTYLNDEELWNVMDGLPEQASCLYITDKDGPETIPDTN